MGKTLDEILRSGSTKLDAAALQQMQAQAKAAGLTKRVIHIELDLLTGNLKSQTTPMDHVMHLGMLEFYKATVLGNMILGKAAKTDEPAPEPEPAPGEDKPGTGASDPAAPAPAPEEGKPAA